MVLVATLLLGFAEVLYDNSAQTFMPTIVHTDNLETANGGLWSIEQVANTFKGPALHLTLTVGGATTFLIGFATNRLIVWLMLAIFMLLAVVWNVITASLRQSIIPNHLLGRVNSVYRYFAWGLMPIGAALGGITVADADIWGSRELSLRMPFFVAGGLNILLFFFARSKLTTAKIDAARAEAADEYADESTPGD
jgi:MFS family permease